jgi:hypothetical protein
MVGCRYRDSEPGDGDLLMGRIRDMLPVLFGDTIRRAELAEVDGLYDMAIPWWKYENLGQGTMPAIPGMYGNARLAERVWVSNRCQQMNAQQIASMPLEFHGPDGSEPAWVSDPDPDLFPNGIGDAVHSIVDQMYGWGYALLYPTSTYATGYPRNWTQIPSALCTPKMENGRRVYELSGGGFLDPDLVIQIDRNPGTHAHGTSALRAYGQLSLGILASGEQALSVNSGGVPMFYLQAKRPVTKDQATAIQAQWMQRTAARNGGPPVVPPDLEPNQLSINPKDLALLENQEFATRAIATAYGVPSVLLNMALQGGLTYQNPGALGEMWWRFELRNVATRIGNAFSARLLPRGQYVSFHAEDTFAPLTDQSPGNDEQAAVEQPPATAPSPLLQAVGG